MLKRILQTSAAVVAALALTSAAATPPAPTPTRADGGDWHAFHGGGPLTGEAAGVDLGSPPMKTRWTYRTSDEGRAAIEASAAIVGDAVYVADAQGVLHALDLKTGTPRWKYETESSFETTPLVANGRVFVGDMDGVFHAVNAADGKKIWTVETVGAIHSSANLAGDVGNASGGVEHVVFGNDGAEIYCLNAADGKEVWKKSAGDRINSTPAIGWGAALVSGCDAKLRAIDVKTGDERFAADLGSLSAGSPAVLADRMIIGTDQGRVVCLSPDGSKTLWEYTGVADAAMVYSSPAVSGGIAVVGARDRHVHAIDVNTGKGLWTFRTRGDVESSPAIAAGRVYVGSKDKKLYVLDLKTGEKLWEFDAGKAITASPAIAGGAVIVGDIGGTLYCLEPAK
jgi:outer membrane protein assembly factor BamB